MISRRNLIEASASLCIIGTVAPLHAAFAHSVARLPDILVAQGNSAEVDLWVAAMRSHGAAVTTVSDPTKFVFEDILPAWKAGKAVAGLTSPGLLFCFAQLAREKNVQLIWGTNHKPMADGTFAHVALDRAITARMSLKRNDRPDWPIALAALMAGMLEKDHMFERPFSFGERNIEALTSWLFVPKAAYQEG